MQLHIQMWGNSAGIRLPKHLLEEVGAKVGECFDVTLADHSIVLRTARPQYTLADLLAECDLNAPAPDLGAWDNVQPVGQEVW